MRLAFVACLLAPWSGVAADADAGADVPTVTRSRCVDERRTCSRPFHVDDLAPFVKRFQDRGGPPSLSLKADVRMGATTLRERDVLRLSEQGDVVALWIRYHRRVGDLPMIRRKEDYPLHPNGALREATLVENARYRERYYAGGTRLTLDADGTVVADDFYPAIEAAERAGRIVVGVPVRIDTPVRFAGLTLPVGTLVYVNERGRVLQPLFNVAPPRFGGMTLSDRSLIFGAGAGGAHFVWLAHIESVQRYRGLRLAPDDEPITFHPNGEIAEARLAGDQPVDGWPLAGGTRIKRHANGHLRRAVLGQPIVRPDVSLPKGTPILFDENGTPVRAVGPATIRVGTATYETTYLVFDPAGRPRYGALAKPAIVGGMPFAVGSELVVDAARAHVEATSPAPRPAPAPSEPVEQGPVLYVGTESVTPPPWLDDETCRELREAGHEWLPLSGVSVPFRVDDACGKDVERAGHSATSEDDR